MQAKNIGDKKKLSIDKKKLSVDKKKGTVYKIFNIFFLFIHLPIASAKFYLDFLILLKYKYHKQLFNL